MDRRPAKGQVIGLDHVALLVAIGKYQQIFGLGAIIAAGPLVLGGERPCCRKAGSRSERCEHQGAAGLIGTRGRESDMDAFAATAKLIVTPGHGKRSSIQPGQNKATGDKTTLTSYAQQCTQDLHARSFFKSAWI
jgi:hypothetical protein